MNPIKGSYDYLIAITGYFVISILVLGTVLFLPGTIGFYHDWYIGPYPEMNKLWANNGFYKWDSQLGNKAFGTDWIFRLSHIPFPLLQGEVLSKGLLILIMTFSGFGAFCLGKRLKLSPYVSFTAGVLYIFSPIIFTRVVAGYIYYLIAYFLSPLILASFLKAQEDDKNRYFIIAALLLALALVQLQFLALVFVILLIFSLADFKRIKKNMIGLFIVVSTSSLIVFAPIVLPDLLIKRTEIPFTPNQLLSYFTVLTASDLAKSFRMLGYEGVPYSYLNLGTSHDLLASNAGILPSWIFYIDFLLPIIGFSVLLFRRDKYTLSFVSISIIGLFFLKGLNPPFPGIFAFLFTKGLYIFREVWHIAFLYSISITFLVVFFLERLQHLKIKRTYKVPLSLSIISIIVVSNGYPLFLGNFAGYLQTYDLPNEYHQLYNKLLSEPKYNVLILPYVNPIHYDRLRLSGGDPFVTYTPSMIFTPELANRGSPTLGVSTWLLSSIQENRTQDLGSILSGFGIKYVVLRKEFVSNYPNYTPLGLVPGFKQKWYTPLEPVLNAQKDLKIISDTSKYKIYENLNNASKIFAPVTSAGGLMSFDSLLSVSKVTSLSNVAFYPSISANDSLIFVDSKVESELPVNDLVEIGRYAGAFDAEKGWTDNRVSFGYDRLLASRVNEGAFTNSPNSELSFQLSPRYNNKPVEIWIKGLLWEHGGTIYIKINGKELPFSLFSNRTSFNVLKVFEGESNVPYSISIQNINGKNYVEGVYVKQKDFQQINTANKIILTGPSNQKGTNLVQNSNFSIKNNISRVLLYWNDSTNACGNVYLCKIDKLVNGWDDKQSFQLSTFNIANNIWSSIKGGEIAVDPKNKQYELVVHMKLNEWATQSHVSLEGYNESSRQWYQITQCPSGINGPLEWKEFSCTITVPENTTKIRPVLNAGWSSQPNQEATTWFDSFFITKQTIETPDISQIKEITLPEISNNTSSAISNRTSIIKDTTIIKDFEKVNPTLWNVHVNTSGPATIGFAEPYDQSWEATVYQNGEKIEVVKSLPLYGAINAFKIKHTGDLKIVLQFVPQYWYQVGLLISGLTFAVCIIYIIYDWRRTKKIKSSSSSVSDKI